MIYDVPFLPMMIRSHLKKRILVQVRGGAKFKTAGILMYFEDFKRGPNKEIGPKDFFEIASIIFATVPPPPSGIWQLSRFGVNIYTINVLVKSLNLCFNSTRLGFFIGYPDLLNKSAGSVVSDGQVAGSRVSRPVPGRVDEKFFFNIY